MKLSEIINDSPKLKILEFLAESNSDFSIRDISLNAKLSRNTTKLYLKQLLKDNLVKPSRGIGRAKMFIGNMENKLYVLFVNFSRETVKKM